LASLNASRTFGDASFLGISPDRAQASYDSCSRLNDFVFRVSWPNNGF